MEITRTIQIQVTSVINSEDIEADTPDIRPIEHVKEDIEKMFAGNDQVLVTVKDFISDGKKRGKR